MTGWPRFKRFEAGDGFFFKAVRLVMLVAGMFVLGFTGMLELTWPQQIVLGMLTIALIIWLDRSSSSYLVTLTLVLISIFSTFRYGFWRVSTAIRFFLEPGSAWSVLDAALIWMLILAEAYAFMTLFLGYLQTLWPLRRTPVPLPEDTDLWPNVDLLIPIFNEPLSVVKCTALAAMNIDWPVERLNVYLLDDGRREELRRFTEGAGIGYMTRDDNQHAKAGNINSALARLEAPYVAVFDCDQIPTRSFLQVTLGWFLRDSKLGMLQTPHSFYSPDPLERNLGQFRKVPNESELFYGVVQDGNDLWNATFFCGSCAVLRRSALDEIGGMAVETVTEDAHTSLRMQMHGWNTAYINIPQSAGLAAERLGGYVQQRVRWARGMIQILRTDNPLFARGLSVAQRLCYFNAMTHFLYALPRLIFLTAPLMYLVFGQVNVPGYWAAILAYAMPHLVMSKIANSRIQGQHRYSFWDEVYETVLAPHVLLPTMLTLIDPRLGKFHVTAKGGVVNRGFFDRRIAQPLLFLISVNVLGVLCAVPRLVQFPQSGSMWPLNVLAGMYGGGHHVGTVLMNLLWVCFNLVILGVATSAARESRQRRRAVRLPMAVPAEVRLANGRLIHGVTSDISLGGLMIRMERDFVAAPGEPVKLTLPMLDGSATLPATLVGVEGNVLRAQFGPLTLEEEEALTVVIYSRADTWLGWGETGEPDRPLRSLWHIAGLARHGLGDAMRAWMKPNENAPKSRRAVSVRPLLLFAIAIAGRSLYAEGRPLRSMRTPTQVDATSVQQHQNGAGGETVPPSRDASGSDLTKAGPTPGAFHTVLTLSDMGVPDTIMLHGVDDSDSVHFSLPKNQIVKSAELHLRYHFSPALLPSLSHLKISLNGTLLATLPVTASAAAPNAVTAGDSPADNRSVGNGALLESTVTIPPSMLALSNELTFEFVGHYALKCEDPMHSALWGHVDRDSALELAGGLIALDDNLDQLPAPFYDVAGSIHSVIPIVFLSPPSLQALKAAGVVASWFGVLAASRPVQFPVSIGTIPAGNAIVIGETDAVLPPSLRIHPGSGPTISMRTNPSDPYSKVLVFAGDSADDLMDAAYGLALQRNLLDGDQVRISNVTLPAAREPDEAPRWLSTEKITRIGEMQHLSEVKSDGDGAVAVSMRLPPDLFYGAQKNVGLHLGYRYDGTTSTKDRLDVLVNGSYIGSIPLLHPDETSRQLNTIVPVPVSDMRPFSNSVRLRFFSQRTNSDGCDTAGPYHTERSISKDSYLDIQGIPHWATLPNLQIFANAGYPFTRRADLSDTEVVLPESPSQEEIEIFLMLMAHFGAQTGYPVLRVSVTHPDGMQSDGRKDYLVLGTLEDQPAIGRLNASLPVGVDGSGLHIQDTQGFFAQLQHAWWKVRSSDRVQSGELETAGGLPDALIEGIEWPSGSNRSVIVVALRDNKVASNFLATFQKVSQSSDVSQSVSVLQGSHFFSYRIGSDVYRVGSLSLWIQLNMLFSHYQWLMVLSTLFFCFLMAIFLRASLRRKSRVRLQGRE